MSKKREKVMRFEGYRVRLNDDGALVSANPHSNTVYATAAEIAKIAAESERRRNTMREPLRRTANGNDVSYSSGQYNPADAGAVQFGCQRIPYKRVQAIAKLSAAIAARRRAKRK